MCGCGSGKVCAYARDLDEDAARLVDAAEAEEPAGRLGHEPVGGQEGQDVEGHAPLDLAPVAGAVGERAHDQAADGEAVGGHVAGEGAVPRARDLEQPHEADAEHGGARALQEAAHDEHRHLREEELQNWA